MLTTDTQQMQQYQDRMNPFLQQGKAQEQVLYAQEGELASSRMYPQGNPNQGGGIFSLGTAMGVGLGGLGGNRNLQERLKFLRGFQRPQQGGFAHDIQPRPIQSTQHGFNQFGEKLGGFEETLGGYGEQMGGFGETLGGYGEQISGFEEQLGGFGEQFSGMEEQFGGVGEDINEINERLGGIEEGISTLSISKPEQKQNPYGNMFNPFSFIGNWGGSRSRMSYR